MNEHFERPTKLVPLSESTVFSRVLPVSPNIPNNIRRSRVCCLLPTILQQSRFIIMIIFSQCCCCGDQIKTNQLQQHGKGERRADGRAGTSG